MGVSRKGPGDPGLQGDPGYYLQPPQLGPRYLLPNKECLPRKQVPLAFNYNIRIIKLFCEHSLLLMQLPGALAFIERKVIIYCPLYAQNPSSLPAQD